MSALWLLVLPVGIALWLVFGYLATHGRGPVRTRWVTALLPGSTAILRELARLERRGE